MTDGSTRVRAAAGATPDVGLARPAATRAFAPEAGAEGGAVSGAGRALPAATRSSAPGAEGRGAGGTGLAPAATRTSAPVAGASARRDRRGGRAVEPVAPRARCTGLASRGDPGRARARAVALALVLAAIAPPGCAGAGAVGRGPAGDAGRARPAPVVAASPPAGRGPGVPLYGGDRTVALDAAEARAARAITRAFEEEDAKAPALDAGLAAAANELAGRALADGLEAAARQDEVRLALARGGATVPSPVAVAAQASDEDAAIGRLRQRAREAASGADRPDRFGVGVVRAGDRVAAVLLLGRRRAVMEPFPARVQLGATHVLSGRVLPPLGAAEVHVTPPGGKPVRLPGGAPGAGFRVPIAFDTRGRWAVEVLGHGPRGPDVALLLEVWAGEPIPRAAPPPAKVAAEPEDLAGKLALVAREVNALRRSRGLAPLALDPTLTRVAKGYAAEIARTGRFAHRSERTGDPADRVRAAGYRYRRVAENLAQAGTARGAHEATVESPGHLANLLDPAVTEAGYGLAWGKNPDGSPTLILVEVFARPAE